MCLILNLSIFALDWEKHKFLFGLWGMFREVEETVLWMIIQLVMLHEMISSSHT